MNKDKIISFKGNDETLYLYHMDNKGDINIYSGCIKSKNMGKKKTHFKTNMPDGRYYMVSGIEGVQLYHNVWFRSDDDETLCKALKIFLEYSEKTCEKARFEYETSCACINVIKSTLEYYEQGGQEDV